MNERIERLIGERTDKRMEEPTGEWFKWINRYMDRWMYGYLDRWLDG